MPNPYNYSTVVTDSDMFFGRRAILNDLYTRLRNMQSVSIVGMRRIGKSSLQHRLVQTLAAELGPAFVPLYVNLQDARYHTLCGFVSTIAAKLNEQLGVPLPVDDVRDMSHFSHMVELLSGNGAPWSHPQEPGISPAEESPGRGHLTGLRRKLAEYFDEGELRTLCFDLGMRYDDLPEGAKAAKAMELVSYLDRRGRVRELVQMCRQRRPHVAWAHAPEAAPGVPPHARSTSRGQSLHLVLCLDEFEVLMKHPEEFGDDFFDALRALGQHAELAMVTASRRPLFDLSQGSGWTSPFPNIFAQVDLGLLTADAARALRSQPYAREAITLSRADEALLDELGGRHPLFLQMACYHLYEALRQPESGHADGDVGETVRKRFSHDAELHFERVLHHLDDRERAALGSAVGPTPRTWAERAGQRGRGLLRAVRHAIARQDSREGTAERVLKRLERRGIVVERAGDGWETFSAAFTGYVRQQAYRPPGRASH